MQGLLKMADMFFMEELREEVGRRLAVGISFENYVERSKMADTLRSASLATACAKFIVNQGEGGTDWAAMERMPRVTAAVAKMATQVKFVWPQFRVSLIRRCLFTPKSKPRILHAP